MGGERIRCGRSGGDTQRDGHPSHRGPDLDEPVTEPIGLLVEQHPGRVQHWSTHVQAQTDANRNKITETEMQGEFAQTRLAGPADQKRYADALAAYQEQRGSCAEPDGASPAEAEALTRCRARDRAQQPVMRATAAAMKDWKAHLAAMQRSRERHVEDAQSIWIRAWRAAPANIEAYQEAETEFDAPSC